jgi:peptidoglycan/LPS O-acetylase OafA/YrhL
MIQKAVPGFPGFSVPDGVEFFFVLSGFLVGGILIRLMESNKLANSQDLFHFWKRRWLRTLPAYYLVLSLNFIFAYWGLTNAKTENFSWKFLLFAHNLKSPFTDFFWESWSLSIEEWFYFITPIMVIILGTLLKSRINAKKTTFLVISLLIALPLCYRYSISDTVLDSFWFEATFRKTVLTRIDAIMYGVLMVWLWHYYQNTIQKIKWPLFILGVIILSTTKKYISEEPTGFDAMTWSFSVMGIGAALLLPMAASWKKCNQPWSKIVTFISKISYSMYLINLGLVAMVIEKHFMPETNIQSVVIFISFWMIVITASSLLYRYFEKPITDLRDRF